MNIAAGDRFATMTIAMLDQFITANRDEIISRCRAKVATRSGPPAAGAPADRGVPMFLDQLLSELRGSAAADSDIATTAKQHGRDLLEQGCTVSQVVHDYGDICQSVTELAVERQAAISTEDFRTLNRCLDDAIAGAVTEYGRERDLSRGLDSGVGGRQGDALAHDLVKAIHIARFAFEAIRSGKVGVAGSTGTMLALGLDTANGLAQRLIAAPGPETSRATTVSRA